MGRLRYDVVPGSGLAQDCPINDEDARLPPKQSLASGDNTEQSI